MSRKLPILALAAAAAAAAPAARAGETACWIDQGVVVVAAQVAGVTGDFILDTGQAATVLADTQAQGAGITETQLTGEVRLAGLGIRGQPVSVGKIDVRTGLFPTPIAGVIGTDVLKAYVLDLRATPCRVGLYPRGDAPRFGRAKGLPLRRLAGAPAVEAAVSDGPRARRGLFVLATGSDTAVRVSDAAGAAPGAPKPREVYPYGVARPRLRALSFAGDLYEALPSGLVTPQDPDELGEIGEPILSRYRVRFDFPAARVLLAPETTRPKTKRAPTKRAPASPRP